MTCPRLPPPMVAVGFLGSPLMQTCQQIEHDVGLMAPAGTVS